MFEKPLPKLSIFCNHTSWHRSLCWQLPTGEDLGETSDSSPGLEHWEYKFNDLKLKFRILSYPVSAQADLHGNESGSNSWEDEFPFEQIFKIFHNIWSRPVFQSCAPGSLSQAMHWYLLASSPGWERNDHECSMFCLKPANMGAVGWMSSDIAGCPVWTVLKLAWRLTSQT